jgi:hypothetical protein
MRQEHNLYQTKWRLTGSTAPNSLCSSPFTKIGLLVDKHDTATKLYDTTIIHALATVEGTLK